MSFDALADLARYELRQVARIWHPDARVELVLAKNGSGIEVLKGEPAYQLSSGEIVGF